METQIPKALLELIDNPNTTDICLSAQLVAADLGSGLSALDQLSFSEEEVATLARQLIEVGGRRLDQANPFADVSLPGGLRVHAVLKSACSDKTLISIRLHSTKSTPLEQLLSADFANPAQKELIQEIAASGQSVLITGATGTGKTTLLRSMLAVCSERVIAVEDVTELTGPNIICLQTKPKNIEGQGEITLDDLVRQALRMRPDRICIGEVRGRELISMLQALNTGHRGATTLHANSLEHVPERLISIASSQGLGTRALSRLVPSAFDYVIALAASGGTRKVSGIGRFSLRENELWVDPILRIRKLALA
ncbi:MAG: ATPase, T2SS/T4P/T4SS family [Rhodoluna sp.]